MKSNIKLPIVLLLLAFLSSSYTHFQTISSCTYAQITDFTFREGTYRETESCAKCHDCMKQNAEMKAPTIQQKLNGSSFKEAKITDVKEVSFSSEDTNATTDSFDALYPDAFKSIRKN